MSRAVTPGGSQASQSVRGSEIDGGMSDREILSAMSGLLLGLFMAMLSSTIVATALPTILHDLHGGESAYTWIVAATLLSLAATTPLWGKLSDLVSKKLLVQLGLGIYVLASMLAGLSQNTSELIACRVLQGVGVGGVTALGQVCVAAMTTPRERGRYIGYFGLVFALGTVTGPLIGGTIVDTPWLGWRWCFYVGVPFGILALVLLQKTLHLPTVKRLVKVDYLGSVVIAATVSLLLGWVTLAGDKYPWFSWQTCAMVGGSLVLFALAVLVERRAAEPVVPLHLFRHRTVTLACLASVTVGAGMYSQTTFLGEYFQLAREKSPTLSGVYTLPMVLALGIASLLTGRLITRIGRWKIFLVLGAVCLTAGFALLGTVRTETAYWQVAVSMTFSGLGIGMMMQNLVLAVQNAVPVQELGSASALVAFFRTMGGASGVSALGALLNNRVNHQVTQDLLAGRVPLAAAQPLKNSAIPDLSLIPPGVRPFIEDAFGKGVGAVFLAAAPFALLTLIAILFIKEVPMRSAAAHTPTAPDLPASRCCSS
ncbi:MDR family MFS transporter [Streptomyces sp. NPDC058964]|uniref:MDR family MFS transporter n=1 Tax=Streptomyces sp. NPDC058964 TaxID=3346681 RepID=UPI00367E4A24